MAEQSGFSDYIIFVDESGDHGLQSIDSEYPIFVLAFVLVRKEDYVQKIVPAFQALKYKYWGHDQVVFHENEIRKEKGQFGLLRTNKALREAFYSELTDLIEASPFEFVASIIKKEELRRKYTKPYNPYEIALLFCMEEAQALLQKAGQSGKITHLLVEGRGTKENNELELEFRRICDNRRNWGHKRVDFSNIPFEMICVDKKSNSTGLQLADLIARPMGLKILRPQQQNRAYDAFKVKCRFVKSFP